MPTPPNAQVLSERQLSPAERRASGLTWTISYEVTAHPGLSQGAQLFRYYAGMEIALGRGTTRDAVRVTATGNALELRRLLEWTENLLGRDTRLLDAFANERFMEATHQAAPPRVRGDGGLS